MLEGVLANMLRHVENILSLLDGDLLHVGGIVSEHVETLCSMETFYMLEGAFANMLRLSARWRPFTCWREC